MEGPIAFRLADGRWCLLVDQYSKGKGYLPLISENPKTGDFQIMEEGTYDMGKNLKRHGGILPITREEFECLKKGF